MASLQLPNCKKKSAAHKNGFEVLVCINADFVNINHPVHIVTKSKQLSPSAFIPFCELGGNMSAMGVKIDQFDDPVCDSFQAKILNDQICYEIDLSTFKKGKENIEKELDLGFSFLMDYNEDRQVKCDKISHEKTYDSL